MVLEGNNSGGFSGARTPVLAAAVALKTMFRLPTVPGRMASEWSRKRSQQHAHLGVHLSDIIIVVFWAPWCGPCRMLKPVLEEMEAEYSSKIKVVQLNTDEHQAAATEFGVRSIPTTMLFKVVSCPAPEHHG